MGLRGKFLPALKYSTTGAMREERAGSNQGRRGILWGGLETLVAHMYLTIHGLTDLGVNVKFPRLVLVVADDSCYCSGAFVALV